MRSARPTRPQVYCRLSKADRRCNDRPTVGRSTFGNRQLNVMDEPRTQTAATPTDPTFGNGHSRAEADQPEAPADAFGAAMSHVAELREFASHFVAAKADGIKLTVRKITVFAALGVIALLAGGTMVITATV